MLIPDVLRDVANEAAPTEARLRVQPGLVPMWLGLGGRRGQPGSTMGPAQPTGGFWLIALKCDVTKPLQPRQHTRGPRRPPRSQGWRPKGVRTRPRFGRPHQAIRRWAGRTV